MWPTARSEHVAAEAVRSRRLSYDGFQLVLSWKPLSLSAVPLSLYVLIRAISSSLTLHVTLPAHPFHAFALRTPCALPFAGPYGLLLVLFRLSCVLGELRILRESQGLFEDDDVDPLHDIKGQSRSV